jgi:hypothetical protein
MLWKLSEWVLLILIRFSVNRKLLHFVKQFFCKTKCHIAYLEFQNFGKNWRIATLYSSKRFSCKICNF